jgi:hypothetical protein
VLEALIGYQVELVEFVGFPPLVELLLIAKWVALLLQADLCFLDQVVALLD